MKKSRIIDIFKFLGEIKLSKVTDKEVRSAIISNHLQMYKIAKEHEEELKEAQTKMFDGKQDRIEALNILREQYRTSTDEEAKNAILKAIQDDYEDVLTLEREFNDLFYNRLNEETELNLKKVSQEKFVDACVEADIDITSGDLIILTDLFTEDYE